MGELKKNMEERLREGDIGPLMGFGLSVLSILYGIGVRLRFFGYRSGLILARRLPCKVVSVGNISAGGTGKTPIAMYVAERLLKAGKKVVILSRGYGGTIKGYCVVYDGEVVMLGPKDAGDEPVLMSEKFLEKGIKVPVIVGPDRVKAGERIIKEFSPDVIILDDGFQHLRLRRNVDIVLIDFSRPGSMRLLPRGFLREPASALSRADILLIKSHSGMAAQLPPEPPPGQKGRATPAFSFSYSPRAITSLAATPGEQIESLKGKSVFLFAGIADPVSFERTVSGLGAKVVGRSFFSDHHNFSSTDIERVRAEAAEAGAELILTTEKDGIRIKGASIDAGDIYSVEIEVNIERAGEFFEAIDGILSL